MEFDKLAKARTRVAIQQPFFGGLMRGMRFLEVDWCKTAATDGVNIFYSKEFFESLSVAEIAAVIIHEIYHVIWMHPLRRGHRDPTIFNIACDYVINPEIKKLQEGSKGKMFKLPADCLLEPKYAGKSAFEVYNELIKNAPKVKISFPSPGEGDPKDGDGGGGQGQMWGGIVDPRDAAGNPLSKEERKNLESEIEVAVRQALRAAKAIGHVPGGLEGLIEAQEKPRINWQDFIQSWIAGVRPDDYSWSRPQYPMMAQNRIYMPHLKMMGSGTGVLHIDTSGSVSDQELREYATEILGIINMTKPEKLIIIQCDAAIQRVDEWNGEDFSKIQVKGRGGTAVGPVFKYIEEKLQDPVDWFVSFTDMEIPDFPTEAPGYPVLWCSTGRDKAPFGTLIQLRDRYEQ